MSGFLHNLEDVLPRGAARNWGVHTAPPPVESRTHCTSAMWDFHRLIFNFLSFCKGKHQLWSLVATTRSRVLQLNTDQEWLISKNLVCPGNADSLDLMVCQRTYFNSTFYQKCFSGPRRWVEPEQSFHCMHMKETHATPSLVCCSDSEKNVNPGEHCNCLNGWNCACCLKQKKPAKM